MEQELGEKQLDGLADAETAVRRLSWDPHGAYVDERLALTEGVSKRIVSVCTDLVLQLVLLGLCLPHQTSARGYHPPATETSGQRGRNEQGLWRGASHTRVRASTCIHGRAHTSSLATFQRGGRGWN